jgi:hypothetical protein
MSAKGGCLVHLGLTLLAFALCRLMAARRFPRWLGWAGCSAVFLAAVPVIVHTSEPWNRFWDFDVAYYPAGRLVAEDPSQLYARPGLGFVNLPVVGLLFRPFAALPLPQAHTAFTLAGLLAVVMSCLLLVRLTGVSGWRRAALVGAFALCGPLYYSLLEGNLTHFVLLLLAAAAWCLERRRETWLGVLLAAAAVLKPPLGLLLGYFLLRRRWRVAAGAGVTALLVVGASLALFGVGLHGQWLAQCIVPFLGKPLAAYNVQSVSGCLARQLAGGDLGSWAPLEVGAGFKAAHYTLVGLLLGATAWAALRPRTPGDVKVEHSEFAAVLCLALVISPISWTHYYLLLLVPLALYLGRRLTVPVDGWWGPPVAGAVVLLSAPINGVGSNWAAMRFLLENRYFLGGLLFLALLLASRWRMATAAGRAVHLPASGGLLWSADRGANAWGGRPAWRCPLALTCLGYLVLSLLVAGEWTYCARTEEAVERLDAALPTGEVYSWRYTGIVRMAEGRAWAPFVKRRLLPDLARGLAAAVPEPAWQELARWVQADGAGPAWARAQLRRLYWQPQHLPLLLCATALIWLSVFGFMFTCRWLTNVLYECPGWVADALGALLGVALLGGNTDWHYGAYAYDFPNAFVFTLALTAVLARRWWFAAAFAAAAYSKETAVLLILAYALVAERRGTVRFWAGLALLLAVFAGVRGWIELHYPNPPGPFWFPRRNWRYLSVLVFYGWFAPLLGVALARLVAARRLYPSALKKLCLLALPLVGLAYFKGWIEELRQYLEVLPILGLIVVQWVLHEAGVGGLLRARGARLGAAGTPVPDSLNLVRQAA